MTFSRVGFKMIILEPMKKIARDYLILIQKLLFGCPLRKKGTSKQYGVVSLAQLAMLLSSNS